MPPPQSSSQAAVPSDSRPANLQLLPSSSFVRTREKKRPDFLQRNPFSDSKLVLISPQRQPSTLSISPRQSLRRNHSFDSSTPTPTARRFFIPFSKGHAKTGSVDSPLRSAFDPSLQTPDFPPRSAADFRSPVRSPGHRASPLFSPRGRGFVLQSPGTPRRPQYTSITQQQRRQSQDRQDSARLSGEIPPLPAFTYNPSLPAFTYQPSTPPQPLQPGNAGEHFDESLDTILEMPSMKPPDLKLDVQTPPTTNPPTNPPNLPKRSTSIKKGAAPKRAQSVKKSFWTWGSAAKEEPMDDSPIAPEPEVTPISTEPQTNVMKPPASPGYLGDDNYYASDDGYTSRSATPPPFSVPAGPADTNVLVKELEDISTELAASIRREMDLEDEIDRLRTEMPAGASEHNRRTSDYYSDSGASSARFPPPDMDLKLEGLEKMRRKAEQEKAQLRVDMTQKLQEDLNQRRALEMHITSLEEQIAAAASSGSGRERELETQLEDMKRRLNDEKEFKANFEDLLAGMREEIENFKNERDNLRDEVVPKLRAQIDGLESQSSENQSLQYENTRMQQDLQNLKNEISTLQNARKLQMDSRIKSIAEEGGPGSPEGGLSRSNSLTRSNSLARNRSVRGRAGSLLGNSQPKEVIPPEALPERLKDAEEQRDALQRTLKSLILRQSHMTKQHTKQLRLLQADRDKALSGHPRRAGFAVEVQSLRAEVNELRLRADDALEQKFQCEKGLSGLKMDLERAQQETSSLRELLQEHDISIPDNVTSPTISEQGDALDRAFADLRRAHADSIAAGSQSPSAAGATSARMQDLAQQVQVQKANNSELRERLAHAIGRGEKEQEVSAKKINDLQSALRAAEERVMSAQSVSEDVLSSQEEHVRDIKDAASDHSKRNMKTPAKGMSSSGRSASQSSSVFDRTRLNKTTSGKGISAQEASRVQALQQRVQELEQAAGTAEAEMQGVVERMNSAQIEVAELQMQRDEAQKTTRKLQKEIETERSRYGQ